MEILIATSNEAKIKKYSTILKEIGINYKTLKDINVNIEVEETGKTSKENSVIKAKAYYEATKMPVIVDDCSLIIDSLPRDKQPGVLVRRNKEGKRMSDEEMIQFYSKELEKIGGESTGGFDIAITIVDEHGKTYTAINRHNRFFVSKPCKERTHGYPLNSLIYEKDKGRYLAEHYEGKDIYKGSSFINDYDFIKSVLIDRKEKR